MGSNQADQIVKEFYSDKAHPLPSDPQTRANVLHILEHGYVILPNVFSKADADAAIAEIDRLSGSNPAVGRDSFEGFKTNRILSLLNKTRVFDKFCLLPQVHALNEFFLMEEYQIYIMETIVIGPGEKPQVLHHDDAVSRLPRPRAALSVATMLCLEDYTTMNGATRIVPGSHKWGSDRIPEDEDAVSVTCPAGSVIYFLGTTWHSGGQNRTQKPRYAATVQYCQPFVRPLENLMWGVDPRKALNGDIPRKIVDMMGYRSGLPFHGHVDGMNPRKGARRMVRWLQEPINYNPPTFASEPGEKEGRQPERYEVRSINTSSNQVLFKQDRGQVVTLQIELPQTVAD